MAFAVVALLSFGSNPAFSADEDEESAEVEEVVEEPVGKWLRNQLLK